MNRAQAEYDNARKRTASKIDPQMSRHGATLWDTHEGGISLFPHSFHYTDFFQKFVDHQVILLL
jgi:hypothetical protein